MNLVTNIIDLCSSDMLEKISAILSTDEETCGDAVKAAIPALLAGLTSVASREGGTSKLTAALNGLGSSSTDEVTGMLGGNAESLAQRGTHLLGSLFGENSVSSLSSALGKYAGMGASSAKKLLSLLAPLVMGKLASVWKVRGATQQALTSVLAEQRNHIAEAMPAGFSLADVPGWATMKSVAASAESASSRAAAASEKATRPAARWAVPVGLALLIGFLLWNFLRPRSEENASVNRNDRTAKEITSMKPVSPELPAADLARVNSDLRSIFQSAGDVLRNIKDDASANAARPKLEALSAQIDEAKRTISMLPATSAAPLREFADKSIAGLKDQASMTLKTPGIAADIRRLIEQIMNKLMDLFAPATANR